MLFSIVSIICIIVFFNWTSLQALPIHYKYPKGYNTHYWGTKAKAVICDSQETWILHDRRIYTNAYYYWRLWDNRPTYKLPEKQNPYTKILNNHLHENMLSLRDDIANNRAQIIYFLPLTKQKNIIDLKSMLDYFNDSTRFTFIPFDNGFVIHGRHQSH